MSAPPLSKLVRFLLIAAGLVIVLSIAWSFVDAGYSNFLTGIARKVVSAGVTVEQSQGTITFTHTEHKMGLIRTDKDWIDSAAIQFGLLLAVALMAATPGLGLKKRGLFIFLTALITFALQLLSVVIMAKTYNSLFFVIVSDLFPALLWAAFSLKYLFSGDAARAPTGQPVNPAPAPAKKGRKSN